MEAVSEQFRWVVTLAGEAPLIYGGQAPLLLASTEPRGPRRPVKQSLARLVRENRPHKRSPTTGHKLHKEGLALGDIQATKHGLLGLLEPGPSYATNQTARMIRCSASTAAIFKCFNYYSFTLSIVFFDVANLRPAVN